MQVHAGNLSLAVAANFGVARIRAPCVQLVGVVQGVQGDLCPRDQVVGCWLERIDPGVLASLS